MTEILFRQVRIETVEQAEALPDETPYLTILNDGTVIEAGIVGDEDAESLTPKGDWHHVALVPIEAKTETTSPFQAFQAVQHVAHSAGTFDRPHRRLVTHYEEDPVDSQHVHRAHGSSDPNYTGPKELS